VVRNPVASENDCVAIDELTFTGVEVFKLDCLHSRSADDASDARARGYRHSKHRSASQVKRRVGLGRRVDRRHHGGAAAGHDNRRVRRDWDAGRRNLRVCLLERLTTLQEVDSIRL
jgi:hypothetical protein